MGLLEALDLHKNVQSGKDEKYSEVEYRLYSWGEICSPFIGDREHSVWARHILADFPFKLFSSSNPYDELPQKLCLTFKAPYEMKINRERVKLSGIFSHEIAKEFAAFLSLVTRRRVLVGKQLRYDGLPIEEEVDQYERSHFQERQRLKELEPKKIYQLLDNLQSMDRYIANGYILALRLYHLAIEMAYTEPEFSYLLLVTCLEAISSAIFKEYTPENKEEYLDSTFPGWNQIYDFSSVEQKQALKDLLLRKKDGFVFQKLRKFVTENVPERFFSDKFDDSKPDYLVGAVGDKRTMEEFAKEYGCEYSIETDLGETHGHKYIIRNPMIITEMEKIEKDCLKQRLRDIYEARSQLIHAGVRLPRSIVFGLFRGLPAEVEMVNSTKQKHVLKIPPLITLERLVSYSMAEFLCRQYTKNL